MRIEPDESNAKLCAPMLKPAILCGACLLATNIARAGITFVDANEATGLPWMNSARLTFVDLNADGRADIVARVRLDTGEEAYRVLLNRADADAKFGFRFVEIASPDLPAPIGGDVITFADLDNDGFPDAVFTKYLDTKNPKFVAPTTQPTSTCWLGGKGDGTFGAPNSIDQATPGTTACIAVGDANGDGLPDIALGNWYDRYGDSNTAYPSDLLIQHRGADGLIRFERRPLPDNAVPFDEERDAGARPTYGVMFVRFSDSPLPAILQLSYGRRANRLYVPIDAATLQYEDRAVAMHLDGDDIRHGKYPDWLKEIAKTDKRFDRGDEKPFRSHGNNFDAAVGDVNGDGKFDLFIAAITHAWAGESSDRSRFLIQRESPSGQIEFQYDPRLSVDREGTHPATQASTTAATQSTQPIKRPNWNQGDLFASLADLDHDGRLDLVLCSSDYPDTPPHENRLRIFHQEPDGRFFDVTSASGIDHVGAQQPSLADLDGDGDLDLLVGQSFNRFSKEMIEHGTPPGPVARVFLNQTNRGNSITLKLVGDPKCGVTRSAFNAIVRLTTVVNRKRTTQVRQLIGPGGHNGKAGDGVIHFGLGEASEAEEIRIDWARANVDPTVLRNVKAGAHTIELSAK
ncbi:hypothetical protein BH09PLA1_BH09PLA1_30060 [soil metagenome]